MIEGPLRTHLSLFKSEKPPKLSDILLVVTDPSAQDGAQPLFQLLANHDKLVAFNCIFESDSYRLSSSLFEYVILWRSLKTLKIRTEQPAEMSDDDFGSLASAMPTLEVISISIDPMNFQELPNATFRAVYNIARGCPDLIELGIFINTDPQFIPVNEDGYPTFSQIEMIDFGLSTVVRLLPSVIFLERVCGGRSPTITSGLTTEPRRRNVPANLGSRVKQVEEEWANVAKGLEDLRVYTGPLYDKIAELEEEQSDKEEESDK